MWGIPAGLAAANVGEWFIHRYLLHGLGRRRKSFWAFHWHQHHRDVRRQAMLDANYIAEAKGESPWSREVWALVVGGVVGGLLLMPLVPFFVLTVWYRMYRYYVVHRRSHLDKTWARGNLPWHYDHHMGKNQNANWCVTHPWFDYVMGTRVVYAYEGGQVHEVPQPKRWVGARLLQGFKESWACRRPKVPELPNAPAEPKPQRQSA